VAWTDTSPGIANAMFPRSKLLSHHSIAVSQAVILVCFRFLSLNHRFPLHSGFIVASKSQPLTLSAAKSSSSHNRNSAFEAAQLQTV